MLDQNFIAEFERVMDSREFMWGVICGFWVVVASGWLALVFVNQKSVWGVGRYLWECVLGVLALIVFFVWLFISALITLWSPSKGGLDGVRKQIIRTARDMEKRNEKD